MRCNHTKLRHPYSNYKPSLLFSAFVDASQMYNMALLVAAIIGREITMSALREWAASCSQEAHQAVAVSSWGKWKTATQVTPHASTLHPSVVIRQLCPGIPGSPMCRLVGILAAPARGTCSCC